MRSYLTFLLTLTLLGSWLGFALPAAALPLKPQVTPLSPLHGVQRQLWTYTSGSLAVKGRLYYPQSCSKPLPLIIFNHDGISGISPQHKLCCVRLARRGYLVFAPSYRGEDGSQGGIEIAKGEVQDVLAAYNYLRSSPYCQSEKGVVLMGASHGALISLLAAARLPQEEVRGLIFAYGVADIYAWWDYLRATNQLGGDPITRRTYGDGPQARPASFALRHGLSAVPHIQAPVLILQGQLDTITPPSQAEALFSAFQAAGREVTLRLYPHCLHGFLVYAPYLTKGVSAQEKAETEEAWEEVFTFLQGLS